MNNDPLPALTSLGCLLCRSKNTFWTSRNVWHALKRCSLWNMRPTQR